MAPDPRHGDSFNHQLHTLSNGLTYHYVDEKPAAAPPKGTCILFHGFPDLWFGWRYTIQALVAAGYRVIVPSQLGYFRSSKPDDISKYGYKSISRDMAELLDHLKVDSKVFVLGHDWGGHLAWRFCAYQTERVHAVLVVCTPYAPPAQVNRPFFDLETVVKNGQPQFGYQIWFASEEGADLLTRHIENFMVPTFSAASLSRHPPKEPSGAWSGLGRLQERFRSYDADPVGTKRPTSTKEEDPELHYYIEGFKHYGIRHALNWYKSRKVAHDEETSSRLPLKFPSSIPALFVTGTADEALPPRMSDRSPKNFDGEYTRVIIEGADHWLLQNKLYRDSVNKTLLDWMAAHPAPPPSGRVADKARL